MSGIKRPATLSQGQRSIASFFTPSQSQKSKGRAESPCRSPVAEGPPEAPSADPAALDAGCLHPVTDQTPTTSSVKRPADAGSEAQAAGLQEGQRVRVHWPAEKAWFEGTVQQVSVRGSSRRALVLYDDGDEEWVVQGRHQYEVLTGGAAPQPKRPRRAAVVDSEDSESDPGPSSGSDFHASEAEAEASADESLDLDGSEEEDDEAEEEDNEAGKPARRVPARPPKTPKTPATGARLSNGMPPSRPPVTPATLQSSQATAARLSQALETPGGVSTPRPEEPSSALKDALDQGLVAGEERFGARAAARFAFLHPDRIMDASRRRPDDPNYDPTTLFVPPAWFKEHKVSEGQRQWWGFKQRNYDAVLLFKMGKFYEMFEMDAHVGVGVLGLSYMRGEQPHAGFPEAAYPAMAAALARAGHKVAVIEQTETPEGLAARNALRTPGAKKEAVVRRDRVAVLTPGTLADADMVACTPDPIWLLCLHVDCARTGGTTVGMAAAAIDVAGARLRVGAWADEAHLLAGLRSLLCTLRPSEVVSAGADAAVLRVVRGMLPDARLVERGAAGTEEDLRDAERWMARAELFGANYDHATALCALRLAARYVRETMVADQLLELAEVEGLLGVGDDAGGAASGSNNATSSTPELASQPNQQPSQSTRSKFMALDAAALENLELLEGSDGTPRGSLVASIDHCATPGGRALLRAWVARPLFDRDAILRRQDAVAALMGPRAEAGAAARKLLAGLPDARRAVVRLAASGLGVGSARDAPHVVLYEDTARRRVRAVAGTLRALRQIEAAMDAFRGGATSTQGSADQLDELVTPGRALPADYSAALAAMLEATDWTAAETSGSVVPAAGVDAEYDAACADVDEADQALEGYLEEVRRELGVRQAVFVSVAKESHAIQVPEQCTVPRDWEPVAGKKGVRRYVTPEARRLVRRREEAHARREAAQAGILTQLLRRFAAHKATWLAAVECASRLDALMSLAIAATAGGAGGPMCRPEILAWDERSAPVFRAKGLRHPVAAVVEAAAGGGAFVPNDIALGGGAGEAGGEPGEAGSDPTSAGDNPESAGDNPESPAPVPAHKSPSPLFQVLTGPNMGGKSTLMRQVCLAAVLAQVGAWVPAERLALTPADAVYVRMGARDRILLGQSTFFVEMAETSAALAAATRASLVVLDELGRGTATADGAAIAGAVLEHLATRVRCRGVFATHYRSVAEHAERAIPEAGVCHMACRLRDDGRGREEVVFLYKLADGICPSSYGVNVARLAGLPEAVVARASHLAKALEEGRHLEDEDSSRRRLAEALRHAERGVAGAREAASKMLVAA